MPDFRGNIGERAVTVVVKENVGIAGKSARAAHRGNAFPLADGRRGWRRRVFRIELDVIADEKIEKAVAVVVEPRAAGAPANFFVVDTRFSRDVAKCSVAIVVKQNVVAPEAAEEIVPAVVVVVAHADSGLPAGAGESGFFGDVGERSVAIVFVQVRRRSFARGPVRVEARSVRQIDIEPAVVVVIEKGETAAFGFDDVVLVIDAAPNVRGIEAGFLGHVNENDR